MPTYHIHISGRVQGVGFRPFVCRLASQYQLTGTVANSIDGLDIYINAIESKAKEIYSDLLLFAPENSIITQHHLEKTNHVPFPDFRIIESSGKGEPDLLLNPDLAICEDCKNEITDINNRRNGYAFTTCLQCGPRYSIIHSIPYDRNNTTMSPFKMCPVCNREYQDIEDRRHYSQTNSCPHCAISMHLYSSIDEQPMDDPKEILPALNNAFAEGKIVAVKGIGGYLFLCDATREEAILTLRNRKHRPFKPFAVLYPTLSMAEADLYINEIESAALNGKVAPIVLCKKRENNTSGICMDLIAPHLDKVGIMLPYSPLLQLIASQFDKPLIATSANLSGSPIVYDDDQALDMLWDIADLILTYDREIVTPQDDSVWQYTEKGQRIVIRRSRGMAPDYYPHYLGETGSSILAMGADMKSAFAIHHHNKIFISQFLGDQEDYLSQQSFANTKAHLLKLINCNPVIILTDAHPAYHTSLEGKKMALEAGLDLYSFQHHKAHFAAVLAENNLMAPANSILGFVWDGTGYGDDGQIWGGELFRYDRGEIDRLLFLDYFPQLLGDKMSREPRLSAMSLLRDHPKSSALISRYFSTREWEYYQKLLSKEESLLTSSMGRLMDGVAALMGICTLNTYEGQAAMEFEALARSYNEAVEEFYPLPIRYNRIDWRILIEEMIADLEDNKDKAYMAKKFYVSLVRLIEQASYIFDINELAFSGGVFQNALLTEMITESLSGIKTVYFHQQLSPNDESIALGQLALYHIENEDVQMTNQDTEQYSQLTQ